jgi:uncharacterized protein (TIGR02246 family)
VEPADVIEQFGRLLSAGDVQSAAALYEPDAAFVVEPGTVVVGRPAIEAALEQFAALRPTLTSNVEQVVEAGGVALVVNRWTLDGTDGDGSPVRFEGRSSDVLRRAQSGAWRITIDDPWGGASP